MGDEEIPPRPPPPLTWRDVLDRIVGDAPWRLLAGAVGVLVVAGVAWWALRPPPAPAVEATLPLAGPAEASASTTSTTAEPAELVVHAAGAVASPGVHRVPAGGRVADLLAAAGGPAADADLDRVNLAAALVDGQRVWFPRVGEPDPPVVAGDAAAGAAVTGGTAGARGDAVAAGGPIDLNTATVDQLESLPGVGPSIAAAIVEHRERSGPFRSVDDLLDVPGIGPARLDALRELVTV